MGRLRQFLRSAYALLFAPIAGENENTEHPNANLVVEAMLHGRSCCG
jgi:hypothetical protein